MYLYFVCKFCPKSQSIAPPQIFKKFGFFFEKILESWNTCEWETKLLSSDDVDCGWGMVWKRGLTPRQIRQGIWGGGWHRHGEWGRVGTHFESCNTQNACSHLHPQILNVITFFVTWGRNQKPGKTGLVSGRARSTISLVTSNSKTQILKLTKTNTNTNTHKYK